ncbi:hypothetical protein [Maridesulfovibrio bastinii]|uniref:hypothetical protein n=1 Tax=Maridesulfovibrio bastinii TaxID=47157 RepID=UPI0006884AEF|nr:hypothetical protein [Maridesulfovibrio bastinii]
MDRITLDGTKLVKTGQSTGSDTKKKAFTDDYGESRFKQPLLRNFYNRAASPATVEISRQLNKLKNSIASFKWPDTGFSLNQERLIAQDSGLDGHINASLSPNGKILEYNRMYSRGFTSGITSVLDDRAYKFQMTLGDESETFTLDVTDGMKNGEVLEMVADAINSSRLHVQASVVNKDYPGINQDDLLGSGDALVFSVNSAYGDRQLGFRDLSGGLISSLELKSTEPAIGPAEKKLYSIEGISSGSVSTFLSGSFESEATSTLEAGEHSIGYTAGSESGTVNFTVEDGDKWSDVLGSIVNAVETASERLDAEVVDTRMPSQVYSGDDFFMTDGLAVKISMVDPKIGERLELSPDTSLDQLKLGITSQPGSDSRMIINGSEEVRSPGLFSLDKGRVQIELEDSFSETLPLKVVDAIEKMESAVSSIAESYNSFRKNYLPVKDLFQEGFGDIWRTPLEERSTDLEWMGLREAGKDKMLWFDSDAFYKALGSEPDRVNSIIENGDQGLFPEWDENTGKVLKNGVESYLINESSLPDRLLPEPSPRTEIELEKSSELLDLYENKSFDFYFPASGPLVNLKG